MIKMSFTNFYETVSNNIKSFLPNDYKDAEVSVMDYQKLNTTYKGLIVKKKNGMISPIINLNLYYKNHQNQPDLITMEKICEKIAEVIVKTPIDVNLKSIMDYDTVKDNLFIRVSSAEKNKDILKYVPHRLKEDLAITYHVAVDMDEDVLSSTIIKNNMLKHYGITAEQLHEDANKSSYRVMTPTISSMETIIEEIIQKDLFQASPKELAILQASIKESTQMPSFFVVSNRQRINGASVIFYPGVMKNIGNILDGNFYILPSSIHEMLVLPDDGKVSADELKLMVTEVNMTEIEPAERLTDSVYYYDTISETFKKVC